MFTKMDHVGLSVRDMNKAIEFYRDVIGMEKVMDREFEHSLAKIVGIQGAGARIVHMKLGDSIVELFHYHHPKGRKPQADRNQSDLGLSHIGFQVENFKELYQKLLKKNVVFLGEPVEIRPGVFVAYFYGSEGEVCEMREII